YAFTCRLDRQPRQLLPRRLVQPRTGVEQDLQLAEKVLAQRVVGAEVRDQRLVTFGYVEIDGRCDLAQISCRLRHARWSGVAVVDIKRPAVGQHHIEIVVAAEGMAPGQPVDDDRRLVFDEGKT